MNYYEENMECLKLNHKYFYSELMDKAKDLLENKKLDFVKSADARDGNKIITISVSSVEYRLNSSYRPIDEAEKWVEQFSFTNLNNVFSMFGFGNGIFARAIINKMKDTDRLLIYEPNYDIFDHILHNYDITDILANKKVIVAVEGINEFEFSLALKSGVNIANLKSLIQCNYPNYDKIFAESCLRFYQQLKDIYYSTRININTGIRFGKQYIDNTLKNLRYLKQSFSLSDIKDYIPENIPAIVVAAGPSVQDNIEYLKKAQGKAIIFAADRILDYLLDMGVIPDFVVTIDPVKDVKYFSKRDDITIPLICYFESNHEILSLHKGPKVLCTYNNNFIEDLYRKIDKIPSKVIMSGSVAIVAYSTCVSMGFKRIILVGQDLAYKNGFSHAGGVSEDIYLDDSVYLEGIDGNPVKSRYDWKEHLIRYQDLITVDRGIEVIDAKQYGARIKGTVVMPLEEVVAKYCVSEFNMQAILQELKGEFNAEDMITIRDSLQGDIYTLKQIQEKDKAAVKLCNTVLKDNGGRKKNDCIEEAGKKIGKINKFIMKQPIYSFMDRCITSITAQYLSEILLLTENEHDNIISTYKKSKIIYEAVDEVAGYTLSALEEVVDQF